MKILTKLDNKIPKYQGFKAKWTVYLLAYVACITFCFGLVVDFKLDEWKAKDAWAELEKMGAAMHGVREVRAENTKLKQINEELINSIGDDGKPVVVKVINDGSAKSVAMFKARQAWGDKELAAFEFLLGGESGFRPDAQNPTSTAYGMFQFLDATWKGYNCEKTEEISHQIDCGIKYIKARYGTPTEAYRQWLSRSPHWY